MNIKGPINNPQEIINEMNLYFAKVSGKLIKDQISTVQYCLKLQNIIYCIVSIKKHH